MQNLANGLNWANKLEEAIGLKKANRLIWANWPKYDNRLK